MQAVRESAADMRRDRADAQATKKDRQPGSGVRTENRRSDGHAAGVEFNWCAVLWWGGASTVAAWAAG